MQITISREQFLKPLMQVSGAIERKHTLPILSNVLLEVKEGVLYFTGTDMEIELVASVVLAEPVANCKLTLPAKKLLDICKSLPDSSDITLTVQDAQVLLTSGKSRFSLATLAAEDFPNLENWDSEVTLNLTRLELRKLLESTSFSMANQDVRYYLNGMLWELTSGQIRTVATDGHRMALADGKCDLALQEPLKAIVPRKGVVELQRLLDDDSVKIVIGTNHIRVIGGDYQFTSKLVDGAYPDYDRVLPKGGDKVIQADRLELKGAFGRAAILSNEKYRGVRLSISEDSLKIVANNPEQEEAQEDMEVNYKGEALEIGFNVSYLLDVFNTLEQRDIKMTLLNSNSSVLIESVSDESALYVVMPMRL